MTRLPLLLITAAFVSACAQTEPADPSATDDVQEIEPTLDTAEDPTAPGNWEAGALGQAQSVVFRDPDDQAVFTIHCDLRGGLVVQRPGLIARGNLALMQLRTDDVVRRLAVNAGAGEQPQVEARVPYNDELIPALMRFDEPLEVRYEGLETLVLPPNPLVGDLVRTCQQSNTSATPIAGQPQPPADAPVQPQNDSTAVPPAPPAQPQQPGAS